MFAYAGFPVRAAAAIGARVARGRRKPRLERGADGAARVDDHELAVIDQPERSSGRTEKIGHVGYERLSHLLRRRRG